MLPSLTFSIQVLHEDQHFEKILKRFEQFEFTDDKLVVSFGKDKIFIPITPDKLLQMLPDFVPEGQTGKCRVNIASCRIGDRTYVGSVTMYIDDEIQLKNIRIFLENRISAAHR